MSLVIHNLHSSFSHPLLQLVFVHIMQEWVETNGGVVAGTLTCLRWMSSKGIHSHYLFDNCFEVLCVVCRRVKITWGCHWLSQSCSEVVFELHQHIHTLWHSHNCIVRLVGMQSSNVVLQVPAYMQLNKISETTFIQECIHGNIMPMQDCRCMKWHTDSDVLSAGPGECCILLCHGY